MKYQPRHAERAEFWNDGPIGKTGRLLYIGGGVTIASGGLLFMGESAYVEATTPSPNFSEMFSNLPLAGMLMGIGLISGMIGAVVESFEPDRAESSKTQSPTA